MKANTIKDKLTIGVFSSSSPISATVPIRYQRGVEYLKDKGFSIVMVIYINKKTFIVQAQ